MDLLKNWISEHPEIIQRHTSDFICEKWNKDAGLTISRSDFGKGFTFLAFLLIPSDFEEDFEDLAKHG